MQTKTDTDEMVFHQAHSQTVATLAADAADRNAAEAATTSQLQQIRDWAGTDQLKSVVIGAMRCGVSPARIAAETNTPHHIIELAELA